METFPKRLGDTDKDRILLKYRCKCSDDKVVWAGLLATRTSAEMWRSLLSDGHPILEIGVFLEGENVELPLLGEHGIALKMDFWRTKGTGVAPIGLHENDIAPPTTYQVGLDRYICILSH